MAGFETFAEAFLKIIEAQSFASFLAAFGAGIIVSLTPCVYPLIPITFSVVTSASLGKRHKGILLSLMYALGLSLGYTGLGLIAAFSGRLFGSFQNQPLVFLVIGNIFLFFALAMFNAVNIPGISLWKKEYDKFSGGYIYVFFLGMVSALTISPCLFPVLGAILALVAYKKSIVFGTSLLFSFSLGMGVLFVIIGFLSSCCITLPKSGKWMDYARKILGTIFLLIAEYFIMKAGGIL